MHQLEDRLKSLPVLLLAGITLTLASYMGLVGVGHWQIDEYHTISTYRTYGVDYLWFRMMTWSPRPFSETLIYFYSTLVNQVQRPLTTEFLSILWSSLILSLALPAWFFKKSDVPTVARLIFVLLPIYLTFTVAKTGEVFYWPFGAAAYIPTIAAISVMLGTLAWGNARNHRILWIGSGTLLAASSEMGAFLIFIFGGLLILSFVQNKEINSENKQWAKYLTLPLFVSTLVILGLAFGRVGNSGEAQMNSSAAHNISYAIAASVPEGFIQLFGTSIKGPTNLSVVVLLKLCCLIFSYSLTKIYTTASTGRRSALLLYSTACVGTIFLTLFAAHYQFGISCCERHETIREFLAFTALVGMGSGCAVLTKRRCKKALFVAFAIGTGMLLAVTSVTINTKKLHAAYSVYPHLAKINRTNWLLEQSPPYRFQVNSPNSAILGELHGIKKGVFQKLPETPSYNLQILEFFAVDEIDFVERFPAEPLFGGDHPSLLKHARENQRPLRCTFDRAYTFPSSTTTFELHIQGWMNTPDAGLSTEGPRVTLLIVGASQPASLWRVPLSARPDVASHFNRQDLLQSGFNVSVPVPGPDVPEAYLIASDTHTTAACRLSWPSPLPTATKP